MVPLALRLPEATEQAEPGYGCGFSGEVTHRVKKSDFRSDH